MHGFGDILKLVAGQYGEISQDIHDLLKKLASTKANNISLLSVSKDGGLAPGGAGG